MKRSTVTSPISPSDVVKLLKVDDKRDRLLFACSFFLGLRGNSELCQLKWKDLLGETAMIWQPKTSKHRELPISLNLRQVIDWAYEGQPVDNYIFVAKNRGTKPLSNAGLNKIIRKHFTELEIKTRLNNSSHCLRKTFGAAFIENNGGGIGTLERLRNNFGHSDIKTTIRYCGIDYGLITEEMNNINYV